MTDISLSRLRGKGLGRGRFISPLLPDQCEDPNDSYSSRITEEGLMSKSRRVEKTIKISIALTFVVACGVVVLGIGIYFYVGRDLPSIQALKRYQPSAVSKFYSEDGELIAEYFVERREVVPLNKIPVSLIQAFVAGEDARFFRHRGLDYIAILRASVKNLFSGEIVQGGSTITQQVVKSLLLSPEKSIWRKLKEAILAYRIEKYLTKDEILYLYLNQIYLGHGAYGVAAASEVYFGKPVDQLTLAEGALLAGLTQAPSKYSPLSHPEQAKRRQLYILNRMVEEGFISPFDSLEASQRPLRFSPRHNPFLEKAPHFSDHVKRYIEEKYGKERLLRGGLRVYTTLDTRMQRAAQEAVEAGLRELEKRQKYSASGESQSPEAALVSIDLETGYVKALVGGRDFKKSQYNRAIQARRQTGSAFKPIVYASALDRGYTPVSILVDSPLVFESGGKVWRPKNFDGKFLGPITVRTALTHSVNVVTVKLAQHLGIEYIHEYARRLGISSPLSDDLSVALGSSSLSLFELTKAYGVFANQGRALKPIFVKKVTDQNGKVLEENLPPFRPEGSSSPSEDGTSNPLSQPVAYENDGNRLISPQTAYIMTHLLQGVVQNGTGWRAKSLGRPVAAKTGTTDQFFDAWFIGYTPELVTGVWVGFDSDRSLGEGETGARAAAPIWVDYMSKALKDKPIKDFPIPLGIEFMRVEPRTGHPSSRKDALLECFREGSIAERKVPTALRTTTDFFKLDMNLSARFP